MSKDLSLKELKQKYDELKSKYSLPDFTELNILFDIEEINTETNFLLKKIRIKILEKITDYSRFIEIILNPSNAPFFFFKLLKKLDINDKDYLTKIYDELGKLEINALSLDFDYSEKNDAEFIKKVFDFFNIQLKKDLLKIIEKFNTENNSKKINGSYFG